MRHMYTLYPLFLPFISCTLCVLLLLCFTRILVVRSGTERRYLKFSSIYLFPRLFCEFSPLFVDFVTPLWSRIRSSWLQIQRFGFDCRHYQIFWEVVGLERDKLSLVTTIEELLERNISGSGIESLEYGSRDPSRWPHSTPYPQNLALTSPTSGDR
jgi:hypothetical protein